MYKNSWRNFADVSNVSPKIPKIEDVRQLTTLLQYPSAYLNYRTHIIEYRVLQPGTYQNTLPETSVCILATRAVCCQSFFYDLLQVRFVS